MGKQVAFRSASLPSDYYRIHPSQTQLLTGQPPPTKRPGSHSSLDPVCFSLPTDRRQSALPLLDHNLVLEESNPRVGQQSRGFVSPHQPPENNPVKLVLALLRRVRTAGADDFIVLPADCAPLWPVDLLPSVFNAQAL